MKLALFLAALPLFGLLVAAIVAVLKALNGQKGYMNLPPEMKEYTPAPPNPKKLGRPGGGGGGGRGKRHNHGSNRGGFH